MIDKKSVLLSVLQTTESACNRRALSCLRSIRYQSNDHSESVIIELRPLYFEDSTSEYAVANPATVCLDLVFSFALSINHLSKQAKFKVPSMVALPEYSHVYVLAQHALSVLIDWGAKERPNYDFFLTWKIDDFVADAALLSLGFRIEYMSIGDTFYGTCDSDQLCSLFSRDTSELLQENSVQGFIWNLKKDNDESLIYLDRGEEKYKELEESKDKVIESLHGIIDRDNVLLGFLCIVCACLIAVMIFF